jgi:Fe-S cluster biogenesis protein NfuA
MIRSLLKKGLGRILGGRSGATPQPKPYPFKYEGAKKPARKAAPPVAEVKPPEPEPVEAAPETPEEIELLSVAELRKRLAAKGIKPRSKARKPELLDMLAEASGGGNGDEDAATPAGLDREAVQELLDDMVRPALQADGGDILLVDVVGMDVHVRLVGACTTCPSSVMTMKMGVEALFKEEFPGFGELVQVN